MNDIYQVNRAKELIDEILPLVTDAKDRLQGARIFGVADVLGGGFLMDLIKHVQINKASRSMEEVSCRLEELKKCLGEIRMGSDYRMEVNGLLTFADFFFDGFIFDTVMLSRIWSSVNELESLEGKLHECRNALSRL